MDKCRVATFLHGRPIADVCGAVELLDDAGGCAAAWSFADLMIGWNKKHAQAAYVPYESEKELAPAYRFSVPRCLVKARISTAIWRRCVPGG